MGWLVNIITSCSLVRSFGNVRGGNKASIMSITHNIMSALIVTVIRVRGRERQEGGRENGREKLRSTVKLTKNGFF